MIKPLGIKVQRMPYESLLISAGYRYREGKGWICKLDKTHRYHIYHVGQNKKGEDLLEIHTDLLKKNPEDKKIYHIASTYECKTERMRLKSLMPPKPPKELTEKQKKALELKLLNSSVDKETINKSIEEAYRKTKEYLK